MAKSQKPASSRKRAAPRSKAPIEIVVPPSARETPKSASPPPDDGHGLPASYAAAWGRRPPRTKGPKPALSMDGIVQAATALALADGLPAVSMSRVAAELGVSTMSLYRYVQTKDELLALMVDAAYREPPAEVAGDDWRDALGWWVRAYFAVLCRHPWIVRIPLSGPPSTPNLMVWFDGGLRCLGATRLMETEKLSVLLLLNGFVRNEAILTADLSAAARASGTTLIGATEAYGRLLWTLTEGPRFPAIRALLEAGVFERPDDREADFTFGLECILDGVAALVSARQG